MTRCGQRFCRVLIAFSKAFQDLFYFGVRPDRVAIAIALAAVTAHASPEHGARNPFDGTYRGQSKLVGWFNNPSCPNPGRISVFVVNGQLHSTLSTAPFRVSVLPDGRFSANSAPKGNLLRGVNEAKLLAFPVNSFSIQLAGRIIGPKIKLEWSSPYCHYHADLKQATQEVIASEVRTPAPRPHDEKRLPSKSRGNQADTGRAPLNRASPGFHPAVHVTKAQAKQTEKASDQQAENAVQQAERAAEQAQNAATEAEKAAQQAQQPPVGRVEKSPARTVENTATQQAQTVPRKEEAELPLPLPIPQVSTGRMAEGTHANSTVAGATVRRSVDFQHRPTKLLLSESSNDATPPPNTPANLEKLRREPSPVSPSLAAIDAEIGCKSMLPQATKDSRFRAEYRDKTLTWVGVTANVYGDWLTMRSPGTRPDARIKLLKGQESLSIQAGQKITVRFTLTGLGTCMAPYRGTKGLILKIGGTTL